MVEETRIADVNHRRRQFFSRIRISVDQTNIFVAMLRFALFGDSPGMPRILCGEGGCPLPGEKNSIKKPILHQIAVRVDQRLGFAS
jgi:hypothetical protein